MVATPRPEVTLEQNVFLPGNVVQGHLRVHSSSPIRADAIQARLLGRASIEFEDDQKRRFTNIRTIVDESRELWRFHTLGEMLGIEDESEPIASSSHTFSPITSFAFEFRLPDSAPTSLTLNGVPAGIRYQIEIRVLADGQVTIYHEHAVIVVKPLLQHRPVSQGRIAHSKNFTRGGSGIRVEVSLGKAVFTSADYIDAQITICNRWKESIKYVHFYLMTKVECDGRTTDASCEQGKKTFVIKHHGVGMPNDKYKILAGESFSFRPTYNVPGLNPDAAYADFLSLSHYLVLVVGRAKGMVPFGELQIPISVVTAFVEVVPNNNEPSKEELLIDLSSSTPKTPITSPSHMFDLLA